jgi:hypothetical protein
MTNKMRQGASGFLLMYSKFTPTCFGKLLPSSGGGNHWLLDAFVGHLQREVWIFWFLLHRYIKMHGSKKVKSNEVTIQQHSVISQHAWIVNRFFFRCWMKSCNENTLVLFVKYLLQNYHCDCTFDAMYVTICHWGQKIIKLIFPARLVVIRFSHVIYSARQPCPQTPTTPQTTNNNLGKKVS